VKDRHVFQGSLFEFQAARNLLSRRPEEAGQSRDEAIRGAKAGIAEGRDAILNLQAGCGVHADPAQLLTAAGHELLNPAAVAYAKRQPVRTFKFFGGMPQSHGE
jgi:hypothetical protein